jgi:8-amino-7-oxononanoate synthase
MGTPSALVYSSGYLANLGAVRAMASLSPHTVLVADAYVHASLVDGCRLAGVTTVFYDHASVSSLRSVLSAHPGRRLVVITESVFSVDGDLAPLPSLLEVCREFGALLLVDDAHGLGVVRCLDGIAGQDDVVITATLSKALGGAGGVVAGPAEFIEHLVDTGRTFIFDTALPPSVAAGVLAALGLVSPALSHSVRDRAQFAHSRLLSAGFAVRPPAGGILSVPAPSADAAVAWTDRLRANNVAVGCFRPPSTPDHISRLRLTVNAGVDRAAFEDAVEKIVETAT